jgi:hypothetical protein
MLPSLSELFNPSYLLLLGIVILSIALLYLYFENKMREQNHKISSMLSLVSSLAEEVNANRANARQPPPVGTHMLYPKKLTVSDDEDDDEDDEDEQDSIDNSEIESLNDDDVIDGEEENDDSDDNSDNSDSDNSENINSDLYTDDTIHMIEIGDNSNIKILKFNMMNMNVNNQQTPQEFDLDNIDNIEEGSDDLSIDDNIESLDNDDDDEDDEDDENDEDDEDTKTNSSSKPMMNLDDLKSINISNLESPTVEYKKLSVAKLRSIAQEKGLIDDASKLKKPELIELLEK